MPTHRRVPLSKFSAFAAGALFLIGLHSQTASAGYGHVADFFLPKSHPVREYLHFVVDGPDLIYSPTRFPNASQQHRGQSALHNWISADRQTRNTLVDEILAGNVLDGLDRAEATRLLGKPDAPYPFGYQPPMDGLFYNCTDEEDWCLLNIEFFDGKVSDVQLRVNN